MPQSETDQLVLDTIREVARGRPLSAGTRFTRVGIGPWQRQRFFGPLRLALLRRGLDIHDAGVTRESFKAMQSPSEVQRLIPGIANPLAAKAGAEG